MDAIALRPGGLTKPAWTGSGEMGSLRHGARQLVQRLLPVMCRCGAIGARLAPAGGDDAIHRLPRIEKRTVLSKDIKHTDVQASGYSLGVGHLLIEELLGVVMRV